VIYWSLPVVRKHSESGTILIQFLAVYRLADFNYRRAQSRFVVNVSVQTANPDARTYTNLGPGAFVYAWGSLFCGYTSDDELEVIIHAHAVDR
jgi:hypothetical protein